MVRRLLTCSILLLTGAVMLHARPAVVVQTPTVDQILEKYVTAVGGRAALEKVTSINATGTIEIADANISGTVELFQKAPDKALTVLELAGLGRQREGFDGAIGWADDPQNGLRQKSGAELAEAKRAAIFGRELKLKTVYPTMTVKGHEVVNGRDTYVVQAVPADGSPATLYFEVESGLMVRQLVSREHAARPARRGRELRRFSRRRWREAAVHGATSHESVHRDDHVQRHQAECADRRRDVQTAEVDRLAGRRALLGWFAPPRISRC